MLLCQAGRDGRCRYSREQLKFSSFCFKGFFFLDVTTGPLKEQQIMIPFKVLVAKKNVK